MRLASPVTTMLLVPKALSLHAGAAWASARLATIRMSSSKPPGKSKLVFLGTPEVAAQTLGLLLEASAAPGASWEVAAVVTQPAQMMGRGSKRVLTPSPVAVLAERAGLLVLAPEKAKDDAFLVALETMQPCLCVTAAFGQWLPKRFLAIPRCGTLNIHPSLLPRWRGASPIQRSLEAGDEEVGVSVLWTVAKMDAGPLAAQSRRRLNGDEKAPLLLEEMFAEGTSLLLGLLPSVLAGECTPATSAVQDEANVVAADKITVEEAQVCFGTDSAATVHHRVRGFAGWPGVWSLFQTGDGGAEERVKLVTTRIANLAELPPGYAGGPAVAVVEKGRLLVPCADGSVLEVVELQAPGKKTLGARAFANGLRGEPLRWIPRRQGTEGEAQTPSL